MLKRIRGKTYLFSSTIDKSPQQELGNFDIPINFSGTYCSLLADLNSEIFEIYENISEKIFFYQILLIIKQIYKHVFIRINLFLS